MKTFTRALLITQLTAAVLVMPNKLSEAGFNPSRLISDAGEAERSRNYPKAMDLYKRAMEYAETQDAAVMGIAKMAVSTGDTREAHDILYKYTKEVNPFQVDAHLAYAEILRKEGNAKGALAEIEVCETLRPGYAPTREQMAHTYFDLKRDDDAIRVYNQILKSNPSALLSRLRRAQISMRTKEYQAAIADYQFILNEKPGNSEVVQLLGDAFFKVGKFDKADETYRLALKLNAASPDVLEKLGDTQVKMAKNQEAIAYFKKCLALEPARLEVGLKLASTYINLQMFKEAEDEYRREMAINPDYVPAVENLLSLWTEQRKIDQVGSMLRNYLAKFPEQSWAAIRYAKLLISIGNDRGAEVALNTHLKKKENDLEAKLLLAYLRSKTGDKDEAIDVLSSAEKDFPSEPRVKFNLGLLYEESGKFGKAIDKYKEVAEGSAVYNKSRVNMAFLMEKTGDKPGALAILKSLSGDETRADSVRMKISQLERELGVGRAISSERIQEN